VIIKISRFYNKICCADTALFLFLHLLITANRAAPRPIQVVNTRSSVQRQIVQRLFQRLCQVITAYRTTLPKIRIPRTIMFDKLWRSRSRWPHGLRHRSAAARLLGSQVRIPLRAWMLVSCVCCVLCRQRSLRRADHSFRGVNRACVCLIVSDLETSTVRGPRTDLGCCVTRNKIIKGMTGRGMIRGTGWWLRSIAIYRKTQQTRQQVAQSGARNW